MRQAIARQGLIGNRQGVTALEYALIAAFMTAIVGGAAQAVGTSLASEFRVVAAAVAPDLAPQLGNGGVSSD